MSLDVMSATKRGFGTCALNKSLRALERSPLYFCIAQWLEHYPDKVNVPGSTPGANSFRLCSGIRVFTLNAKKRNGNV